MHIAFQRIKSTLNMFNLLNSFSLKDYDMFLQKI